MALYTPFDSTRYVYDDMIYLLKISIKDVWVLVSMSVGTGKVRLAPTSSGRASAMPIPFRNPERRTECG